MCDVSDDKAGGPVVGVDDHSAKFPVGEESSVWAWVSGW